MNAFEALGLNEQLVRAVTELGFETPPPSRKKPFLYYYPAPPTSWALPRRVPAKQPHSGCLYYNLSIRRSATRRH